MTNVKLFQADGGKIRGLQEIVNQPGYVAGAGYSFFAAPKEGEYLNMGVAANATAYKIEAVAYLVGEAGVRLIVSPLSI